MTPLITDFFHCKKGVIIVDNRRIPWSGYACAEDVGLWLESLKRLQSRTTLMRGASQGSESAFTICTLCGVRSCEIWRMEACLRTGSRNTSASMPLFERGSQMCFPFSLSVRLPFLSKLQMVTHELPFVHPAENLCIRIP
jgi:hypothetical protein